MTAIKTIALLALALMLASVCVVRAQLPATNPLVVPPLPPSPPAQLAAPVSTAIAPSPLAVPSLPAAYSTPGARLFNCSCSGPGQPTHWMGQVTAASYLERQPERERRLHFLHTRARFLPMELPAGLVLRDSSVRCPPRRRTRARPTASAFRDRRRIQPHPPRVRTPPAHSARLLPGLVSPAHKYVRTAYVTEEPGQRLTLGNQAKPELTEARSIDLCYDFHFPS